MGPVEPLALRAAQRMPVHNSSILAGLASGLVRAVAAHAGAQTSDRGRRRLGRQRRQRDAADNKRLGRESRPWSVRWALPLRRQSEEMLTSADEVTLTEASLPAAVFLTKIVATCASSWIRASSNSWRYRRWETDAGVIAAMLATGSRSDEHGPQGRHHPRGNPIGPTAGRAGHRLMPGIFGCLRAASARQTATRRTSSVPIAKKRTWRTTHASPTHSWDSATPPRATTEVSERATIPASEVGVTLTISDKALKKLDQIQEETIKAAQEDQKFSWR